MLGRAAAATAADSIDLIKSMGLMGTLNPLFSLARSEVHIHIIAVKELGHCAGWAGTCP